MLLLWDLEAEFPPVAMLAASVAQEADCSRNVAVLLRPAKPFAQVVIRVAVIRQAVARAHLECEDVAVTVDGNVGGPALDGRLCCCGRGAPLFVSMGSL